MARFTNIIVDYKRRRKENPDPVIADCITERNLVKVFEMAALARDKTGRKHPHQYRLPNKKLQTFRDRIIAKAEKIRRARSFHELHSMIEECKVKGIGELAIYDTAHRIGTRFRIFPDMVYMHQGTRIGAEQYLNRKITEKQLDKRLFKDLSRLRCDQIEDILCIYKGNIKNGRCLPITKYEGPC